MSFAWGVVLLLLHAEPGGMWDSRPLVAAVLLLLGVLYVRGWWRLHEHRAFGPLRLVSYLLGLVLVAIALLSPLDTWADDLFSVHMVQHALLMSAPVLLLLASPFPVSLWGLPRGLRQGIGALFRPGKAIQRGFHILTSVWLAWPLFVLTYWAWHWPPLFQAALRSEVIHDVEHLSFFLTSLLFWWPVASAPPQAFVPYGRRIVHVALALVQNTALGILITFADRVLYTLGDVPGGLTPLEDQRLGGLIMWVGVGMTYSAALLILSYKLFAYYAGPSLDEREITIRP